METKRYAAQYGHATAIVMRLSEETGVLGTKRTVYGDSFFASVEICEVLASNGLYFKGIVKQSYSKYPKVFLQEWYWVGSEQHARAAKQHLTLTRPAVEVAKSNEVLRAAEQAELERIRLDPTLTNITKVGGRKVTGTRELAKNVVVASAKQRSKAHNPHGAKNSMRKKHASIARGAHLVLVSTLPNGNNPATNVMAVGWADQTLKCFIGTSGNTLPGLPHVRTTYNRDRRYRPAVAEQAHVNCTPPGLYSIHVQLLCRHRHPRSPAARQPEPRKELADVLLVKARLHHHPRHDHDGCVPELVSGSATTQNSANIFKLLGQTCAPAHPQPVAHRCGRSPGETCERGGAKC